MPGTMCTATDGGNRDTFREFQTYSIRSSIRDKILPEQGNPSRPTDQTGVDANYTMGNESW